MAARKLDTLTLGAYTARIYRDATHDEFVVKFDRNGVYLGEAANYYTSDKPDAYGTAVSELRRHQGRAFLHGVELKQLDDGHTLVTYTEAEVAARFDVSCCATDLVRLAKHLHDVAALHRNRAQAGQGAAVDGDPVERARHAALAAAIIESMQ